eukprot:CAMPEP_0113541390 /NCGR_PEP_ID=MMETSP0015_2-20120614/9005_1 /TAXON_ID=2838 /ORGANISM="Odontella" /LENGTH=418 /DNA_ID=CAMNT_0000441291 /DNA_START=17 /DNA_END=1273 /DNA_ORIENTATION=+ /assembly_acc=CAM_ASM_000160
MTRADNRNNAGLAARRRRPTAINLTSLANTSAVLLILLLPCHNGLATAYAPRRPSQPTAAAGTVAIGGRSQGVLLESAASKVVSSPTSIVNSSYQKRVNCHGEPRTRLDYGPIKDADLPPAEEGVKGGVGGGSPLGGKGLLLSAGLTALTAAVAAAKTGILPGAMDPSSGMIMSYSDAMILRDVGAALLTLVLAAAFVKANTAAAAAGIVESRDSRKLIHTLSAPLFVLFWPVFSDAVGARYFAAIVPFMNGLRLVLAAQSGENGDEKELAGAVSRSGDASEALGGPFVYVLVLFASIIAFWTDDLKGVVAVSTMAAGDGVADLIGRRFGKNNKWFFNQSKSVAGTTAFAVAAFLTSTALAWWLGHAGALTLPMAFEDVTVRIAAISIVCAFVELIPFGDDNWTVPLSAAVLTATLIR